MLLGIKLFITASVTLTDLINVWHVAALHPQITLEPFSFCATYFPITFWIFISNLSSKCQNLSV